MRRDQCRDHADIAAPIGNGMIDGDEDVDVEAAPPVFEFTPEKNVGRTSCAIEHDDAAIALAAGEHSVDRRAQWCEAQTARDDDDVAALALRNRPGRAVRPAYDRSLRRGAAW